MSYVTNSKSGPPPEKSELNVDLSFKNLRSHPILVAALICLSYAILNLFINDVIPAECVQSAQVITRTVRYPAGHPYEIFHFKAFALFDYLAALAWMLVPNAKKLSSLVNILYLFLNSFVPFILTFVLTNRAVWGYVASTFTISGALQLFEGTYPIFIFPNFYHHGQLGVQFSLLAVALLLGGFWRIAGLLFGLLPSLHFTFALSFWPLTFCYLYWNRKRILKHSFHAFGLFFLLGLLINLALVVVIHTASNHTLLHVSSTTEAVEKILRNFVFYSDAMRSPFTLVSIGFLTASIVFFSTAGLCLQRRKLTPLEDHKIVSLILIGTLCWAVVYGVRMFQGISSHLPLDLLRPIPYRLSNVTAFLLFPMIMFILASIRTDSQKQVGLPLFVIVTALILVEAFSLFTGKHLDAFIFCVIGVAFGAYSFEQRRKGATPFLVVSLILILEAGIIAASPSLGNRLAFPFSCLLTFLFLHFTSEFENRESLTLRRSAIIGLLLLTCLVTGVMALTSQKQYQSAEFLSHDYLLNEWLAKNGKSQEMIVPMMPLGLALQARTGHPVLVDSNVLYNMFYVPETAPASAELFAQIYGVDYSDEQNLRKFSHGGFIPLNKKTMGTTWMQRDLHEWQSLGDRFHFRLVLCPTAISLKLPAELVTPVWTLYVIPALQPADHL